MTEQDRLEWQDWERWATEVCVDFKIPFDNHKVGMRLAITQWMADKLRGSDERVAVLEDRLSEAEGTIEDLRMELGL